MIEKKLPSEVARVQLEIHNDGLYVAVYNDEDYHGVRNLFKVPVNQIDILDDGLLYKHEPKDRFRYYRLIKQ